MGKTHNLKTWPDVFQACADGRKTFEYRRDDRGFEIGDRLILYHFDPVTQRSSGEFLSFDITYIVRGGIFGIPEGYCIMSILPAEDGTQCFSQSKE